MRLLVPMNNLFPNPVTMSLELNSVMFKFLFSVLSIIYVGSWLTSNFSLTFKNYSNAGFFTVTKRLDPLINMSKIKLIFVTTNRPWKFNCSQLFQTVLFEFTNVYPQIISWSNEQLSMYLAQNKSQLQNRALMMLFLVNFFETLIIKTQNSSYCTNK